MHCAICDADDDNVTPVQKDCGVCQAIINELIKSYEPIEQADFLEDETNDVGC